MATFNVNDTARRVQSIVGSSNRAGPYTFNFQVNATSELLVYQNDTELTLSTQYSATLNSDGTGSITFIDNSGSGGTDYTPAQNDRITIIGDQPLSRTSVFTTGAVITPTALETDFDNVVIRQQQIKEITDRAIQLKASTPRTVTGSGTSGPLEWPYDATASNNADKVIAYDSNGTSLILGPTTANLNTLANISSDLTTLAGISSNITTVAGVASNVTTVAGISSNVTTVANNDTNITTVATNISSVNTVASDITKVVAVANDLAEAVSEVETVANDLNEATSEIDTVANAITNVNNVGNNIANVNSVAGNETNINAVAGNATNINAVAGNATNINAVNSNSTNINTVAGNNTNINTVAGANSNITTVASDIAGTQTFTVTVTNPGSGNVFVIDGSNNPVLTLKRNFTYTFDVSDSSVTSHPLLFKDSGGSAYTTGVTTNGTAGSSGATVVFAVPSNAPSSLRYYCSTHGNAMGNTITVEDDDISIVAGISSDVSTVAGISSNVTTVAGNNSNVSTVAGISSNISTVAGISSNVTTVAGISSNVTTVAGISANVTTVANNNTNVSTVATNISGVNSFAERYRVASSDPTTSLDAGDLAFNTTGNQLKYYDGASWNTVAAQDTQVKISGNDTSSDVLINKLTAGNLITLTETNDGSNETITVASTAASTGKAIAMAIVFG